MIKPEIALKYAKGLSNYCKNFKDCGRYSGCIFYVDNECVLARTDNSPDLWELEGVKIEDNGSTDKA